MYLYLNNNNLLRPGDTTTNNKLLFLTNEIHKAFDSLHSLEVRAVFDIDKVWNDGLLHKLEQKGIPGKLLELSCNYLSDNRRVILSVENDIYSQSNQTSKWDPFFILKVTYMVHFFGSLYSF